MWNVWDLAHFVVFTSVITEIWLWQHEIKVVSCPIAVSFWSDFTGWYQYIFGETLTLGNKEILYGGLNNWSSCLALNHLKLIGKYLIYCKAINRVNFLFADFKALLHQKIEAEKYIALNSNKCSIFYEKWADS